MKSLNTVIEVLEACQNDAIECFECPMRHETECEVKSVALAYLKEYQKIEDEYEELKDWWAEEHAENVPLYWNELKGMEGKPVWLVYDWNNTHFEGWILLDHFEGIFIVDAKDEWALSEVNMDKWKAYRKERE